MIRNWATLAGLVERLCVVGVKPRWGVLPIELPCGKAAARLGGIRKESGEAPTELTLRFHSIWEGQKVNGTGRLVIWSPNSGLKPEPDRFVVVVFIGLWGFPV